MKGCRTGKPVLMLTLAAGLVLFAVSCGFFPMLFDMEKEGEPFYLKVTVMGSVTIDPSVFVGGYVYIGFVDLDPLSAEYFPTPIPWAGFSGSWQQLGYYSGGEGGSYFFTFQNVPKGSYFLLALVDMNSNGGLDLGPAGDPSEPVGAYPMNTDGPYLMEFDADQFNISIPILYEGFLEDFDDDFAQNWVDDGTGRWSIFSDEYIMSGFMSGNYAFSYYDKSFENFTYSVTIRQTSGSWGTQRGIFFRSQNPWEMNSTNFTGYRLGFDGNGNWSLMRLDGGGVYSSLGSGFSGDLNTMSVPNIVEVQCYDTVISVYFNGQSIASFIDDRYSYGMVGIFAWDDDTGVTEFRYDDATLMW